MKKEYTDEMLWRMEQWEKNNPGKCYSKYLKQLKRLQNKRDKKREELKEEIQCPNCTNCKVCNGTKKVIVYKSNGKIIRRKTHYCRVCKYKTTIWHMYKSHKKYMIPIEEMTKKDKLEEIPNKCGNR